LKLGWRCEGLKVQSDFELRHIRAMCADATQELEPGEEELRRIDHERNRGYSQAVVCVHKPLPGAGALSVAKQRRGRVSPPDGA